MFEPGVGDHDAAAQIEGGDAGEFCEILETGIGDAAATVEVERRDA